MLDDTLRLEHSKDLLFPDQGCRRAQDFRTKNGEYLFSLVFRTKQSGEQTSAAGSRNDRVDIRCLPSGVVPNGDRCHGDVNATKQKTKKWPWEDVLKML